MLVTIELFSLCKNILLLKTKVKLQVNATLTFTSLLLKHPHI